MKNPVPFLRKIALLEAVSYLILLGIAVPLKYVWDMPLAVRIMGSIHGALFVVFCWALMRVLQDARWPTTRAIQVFVASLIPFVPFFLDRHMRAWENEWRPTGA
jgi:integral membrane protein